MLTGELGPPFHGRGGGPGGWWILFEPELHLGPDALVPDLAGWRRERMPTVPDVAYFTLPPDWICEVLSPQTGRLDRAKKLPAYAREGVRHAWLIDPVQKTQEVMRLDGSRWTIVSVHGGDDTVRAEPFDAIELTLPLLYVSIMPVAIQTHLHQATEAGAFSSVSFFGFRLLTSGWDFFTNLLEPDFESEMHGEREQLCVGQSHVGGTADRAAGEFEASRYTVANAFGASK